MLRLRTWPATDQLYYCMCNTPLLAGVDLTIERRGAPPRAYFGLIHSLAVQQLGGDTQTYSSDLTLRLLLRLGCRVRTSSTRPTGQLSRARRPPQTPTPPPRPHTYHVLTLTYVSVRSCRRVNLALTYFRNYSRMYSPRM